MTKTEVLPNDTALVDLAGRINTEHEAVCEAAMTATQHAIKCENLLAEAKSGLPHGQWLPWIKENCDLSERTTQAYMRLARRHEELDGEEAQRVADLPVRQAMIAIADHQAEQTPDILNRDEPPSRDEIWSWADRQVSGPFNRFDFERIIDGDSGSKSIINTSLRLIINKLLSQTSVPAVASWCLSSMDDEAQMLRLVPSGELSEALARIAPVAKGNIAVLDIDWKDVGNKPHEAGWVVSVLTIEAQRLCGGLLNEMKYRDKSYKKLSDDEYADRYGSECDDILEAFQANCQRKLEDVKRATAEGRYADL